MSAAVEPAKPAPALADRLGALASTACAVHCLLGAVPGALGALGQVSWLGEELEWAFVISAVDVEPVEAGFIVYASKKANLDFHGAKLCVKLPFKRTPLKKAKNPGGGCSGWRLNRNFNATIQNGLDPSLSVGATIFAQWRQRVPNDPAGFGDGLTNGLRFTIRP